MPRALLILVLCFAAGCSRASRDDLAREVLAVDPAFAQVLEKHQELSSRVETFEQELALKRQTVKGRIDQLREELNLTAAKVREKVTQTEQLLAPDRERLTLALSMASEQLRAKQAQRASIGRSIAKLKKSLKVGTEALGRSDLEARERQLADMTRDAQRLDQELAGLKEHVRLLKVKLLLIRL